jgi:hypothetical protein
VGNVTIPMLPQAIGLIGDEQIEIVQAGASARVTLTQVAALGGPTGPPGGGPTGPTGTFGPTGPAGPNTAVSINYTPPFTGSVTETVAAKLAQTVSVLDFGADPTGVADSTAAIQAAVTAGAGGIVTFPGLFLTSNAIIVPNNTVLIGGGWGTGIKSLFLPSGGSVIGCRQLDISGTTGVQVFNMKLDCSGITSFQAGTRCIFANAATNFVIQNNYFKTCGAATACPGSSFYRITGNGAFFSSTDGTSKNDGTFDQWGGANNFTIDGNTVIGNAISLYPILVTGQNSDNTTGNACFNFAITGNILNNANQNGIWINGRNGVNHSFSVTGNVINTVVNFRGIEVTDSNNFSVNGNTTLNTGLSGIFLSEEATFTAGVSNFTCNSNVVSNANVLTSANSANGSAIACTILGTLGSFVGNCVSGTTHTNAVYLDSTVTNCEVVGSNYSPGTVLTVNNNSGTNKIFLTSTPSFGWGTPTGNTVISNFSGSAATLPQCSAAIAQLIVLLKNTGILNA